MKKIYNFLALNRLIRHYRKQYYQDLILKDWITDSIIGRKQEHRRKELVEIQEKINEEKLFLDYLRKKRI